jgi:4-hydroxy-4-methyl-2-oxoglutarate aldolase
MTLAATDAAIARRLGQLSTADISDAEDRHGITGQCLGIAPLDRSSRLVGRAWTLRYGPVGLECGTVGDYIDDLGELDVVVLDNQGRLDTTVWGDLLTSTASKRKVAGTVIDGVCRDVNRTFDLDYPIYARGTWMRTGKDRVRVEAIGEPVSIGGARVEAGDWLLGDGDGVVVLPLARVEEVLEAAEEIRDAEARIRAAVESGRSLREARIEFGYHRLQTARR